MRVPDYPKYALKGQGQRLKIGIDIRPLRDVTTGVGRYLSKMLRAMVERHRQNNYILFYNCLRGPIPHGLPDDDSCKVARFHWPRKALTAIWAYTEFPKLERFIGHVDVFHSPGFQVPPSGQSALLFTVHDLIAVAYPELSIPSSVRHFRPRVKHYARRADLIVAVSKATAGDVISLLDVPEEKVIVVYPGTTFFTRAAHDDISRVKAKFNIGGEYILFVSRLDPRKNLPRLFKAFELSGLYNDLELLFVGPRGWRMEEIFRTWRSVKCRDRIRWLNYVSDTELACLYSGARFFVFPSVVEGFGLPILEAMSVGCPVMTSNISSMPEVAGEAALYIDPYDIDSIADGLRRLAGDSGLRQRLAESGSRRAEMFTWEKMADNMINAYKRACEVRRS